MSGTRCGFIALVGAPNAGKSTLLNALVGEKVSIVSPKVQTTRTRVTGIAIAGAAQLVFVDTPGIFTPRRRLERAMVEAAWSGAADADEVVVVVDARHPAAEDTRAILAGLAKAKRKAALVLNKIDLVEKPALLAATAALGEAFEFERVFMVSATGGDGVEDLRAWLSGAVPEGPWLFPEDELTDMPSRLLAAEITREKIFLQLEQELPYAVTVETEKWTDQADGSARIDQVVYVRKDGQKAIVLGKGGARIKAIGAAARADMEKAFDRRVHLFLFVKVREGWPDDPERYRALGLEYPK
ncbi:MAG: GTPase Era [Alphaproteobacteria bacterium]|nr:GTPase Era [Alphaproteobacteria bacterium]